MTALTQSVCQCLPLTRHHLAGSSTIFPKLNQLETFAYGSCHVNLVIMLIDLGNVLVTDTDRQEDEQRQKRYRAPRGARR